MQSIRIARVEAPQEHFASRAGGLRYLSGLALASVTVVQIIKPPDNYA